MVSVCESLNNQNKLISRKLASVVDVMSFSPEENMEKRFKKEIRKYTTEIKYVNKRGQITNKVEL